MDTFLAAHFAAINWREAVSQSLRQLGKIPATANLGFLYASDEFAEELPHILTYLREGTGVAQWVGTVGTGICGPGREYAETPAISLMLAEFPENSFRIFDTIHSDLSGFLSKNRAWFDQTQSRFAIVHGDPRNPWMKELIVQLAQAIHEGFLVGGLTSSRGNYVQVADRVTEGGLSGVLFAGEVQVATALTQSCAPFGSVHEITECQDNIIITLDEYPALDVFYSEIGEVLAQDLEKAAGYISVALPIPGSDIGDYLVRNLVGIDPVNRLLAIGEMLEPGQRIQFCCRDAVNAQKDLERMLGNLKARLPHAPKGGVYYSCLGRGRYMFGEDSVELRAIQRAFGDLPVVGFFCNGEISNNRLYGYTGVLTLFL